jgi:hypothetical protein
MAPEIVTLLFSLASAFDWQWRAGQNGASIVARLSTIQFEEFPPRLTRHQIFRRESPIEDLHA